MNGKKFQIPKTLKVIIAAALILANLTMIIIIFWNSGSGCDFHSVGDPQFEARKLVGQANTNPAALKISQTVVFRPQTRIAARGIAVLSQSGLTENQVCLSKGDFSENESFVLGGEGKTLSYKGTSAKETKMVAICDSGKELQKTIDSYNGAGVKSEWLSGCGCAVPDNEDTCCLVAIRQPR